MKSDPNYLTELKKYKEPIPSREYILSELKKENKKLTHKEIAKKFQLNEEQTKTLLFRLKAMLRDKQLIKNKKKQFVLIEGKKNIEQSKNISKKKKIHKSLKKSDRASSQTNFFKTINRLLEEHVIEAEFNDAVIEESEPFRQGIKITDEEKKNLVDLTHYDFVTIDGADAKDFDDAVYVEKTDFGWKLFVSIANVSYYVRPNSALDLSAKERGNSVYFPSYVIPMLPEILSNGLCSLRPNEDRLCLTCEMNISFTGELKKFIFYPSVIHSKARLIYEDVSGYLENHQKIATKNIHSMLDELYALYQVLNDNKQQRGALEIETKEAQFVFKEYEVVDIRLHQRTVAHKMIEECMIIANVCAGRFLMDNQQNALYRIHAPPNELKLQVLKQQLASFHIPFSYSHPIEIKTLSEVLRTIQKETNLDFLSINILQSMQQAVYSDNNIGHFGLGLEVYSHFTSPIRRYSDLIVHRIILYLLSEAGQQKKLIRKPLANGGFRYAKKTVHEIGMHLSNTERKADVVTREFSNWLKCSYLSQHDKPNKKFKAIVSHVTHFGLFVLLSEFQIDGLVHISNLGFEYFMFEPTEMMIYGSETGKTFKQGDVISVRINTIDLQTRKVDLLLAN